MEISVNHLLVLIRRKVLDREHFQLESRNSEQLNFSWICKISAEDRRMTTQLQAIQTNEQ